MKKRIRHGDPQKQSYWEEVVRRWKEGGQSVRDYCRAEGLQKATFYRWRRELARRLPMADAASKLRLRASCAVPASRSPQRAVPPRRHPASFLPVQVVEHGVAEAPDGVEIVLGQGCTVRVRRGFDRQTLVDVMAVLEARPC